MVVVSINEDVSNDWTITVISYNLLFYLVIIRSLILALIVCISRGQLVGNLSSYNCTIQQKYIL